MWMNNHVALTVECKDVGICGRMHVGMFVRWPVEMYASKNERM